MGRTGSLDLEPGKADQSQRGDFVLDVAQCHREGFGVPRRADLGNSSSGLAESWLSFREPSGALIEACPASGCSWGCGRVETPTAEGHLSNSA